MGEQRGRGKREGGPRRSLTGAPVVLVTGASSGIGKITATLLAEQGFRVFGTSRQSHPDERGVEMLTLDVRVDDSIARCLADGERRAARIGALAGGGEILVSADTLDGAAVPYSLSEPREAELKGLSEPVPVVSVAWR